MRNKEYKDINNLQREYVNELLLSLEYALDRLSDKTFFMIGMFFLILISNSILFNVSSKYILYLKIVTIVLSFIGLLILLAKIVHSNSGASRCPLDIMKSKTPLASYEEVLKELNREAFLIIDQTYLPLIKKSAQLLLIALCLMYMALYTLSLQVLIAIQF